MIIDKRLLRQIHMEKIKAGLRDDNLIENYLFIDCYKTIFITRYRNRIYHVYASAQCGFKSKLRQECFDLLTWTEDRQEAVNLWHKYIMATFQPKEMNIELYQPNRS